MGQRSVKLILSRVVCFASSYLVVVVWVANHGLGRPSGGCRRRGDPGIHGFCHHRETSSPVGMCGWSPVRIAGQGGPAVKSRWANVVLHGAWPADAMQQRPTHRLARHEPFDCGAQGSHSTGSQPRKTRPACARRQRPVRRLGSPCSIRLRRVCDNTGFALQRK